MGPFGQGRALLALAGLAVMLAGPAPAADRKTAEKKASEDQLDHALSAEAACMLAASQRLDDGISDAATIAPVVAALCQKERDRWVRLAVRGQSEAYKEALLAKEPDKAVQLATLSVLKARAAARQAAAAEKAASRP